MLQEEQKCDVFEATEATICQAHITKIKWRNFTAGDIKFFKNPEQTGIASTL